MMSYMWGFRERRGAEGFARKSLGMGAIAALLTLPQPSLHPCSVIRGYRVPSDYDLVKSHDVIVLARSEDYEGGQFLFRIRKVLRGDYPNRRFRVEGHTGFKGRTAEDDLVRVRAGALSGSCTARDYRVGYDYVLFGDRTDGGLAIHGPPFSRINEEVDGEHSPWTQAIQRYAEIADLEDPEAEHAALQDLLETASKENDPIHCPPAMAPGLEEHFQFPSPYMPWIILEAMHGSASTPAGRSAVLGAMAACRLPDDRSPVGAFVRTLPIESLEKDDLASAATLAWRSRETSLASAFLERFTDQDELGRAIRDMADESLVPAVIRKLPGLPPKGLALLAPLFERLPSEEARRIISERARALAAEIRGRYDDQWWEAVSLAALGNEEVVDWAMADLERGGQGGCCGLHFNILAWSPLARADRHARAIIEDGDAHRLWQLVGGYEDSPWPERWERWREIATHPSRRDSVLESLREALEVRADVGSEEALDLLANVRAIEPAAPPEPPPPHRFPGLAWIAVGVAGACLALILLARRARRNRRTAA
jgi:hypothetical protein